MKLTRFSYRFAEAVLDDEKFGDLKAELVEILEEAPIPLLDPDPSARRAVKHRKRGPVAGTSDPRFFYLPVDQTALNLYLDGKFSGKGWAVHPRIVEKETTTGPKTALRADYRKGTIQVEVQFGNMARWYSDVFKFQLSYAQGEIDVAILVVPVQYLANVIDENVAYYERVLRELPWAKMSLTLPIWVIGLEPDDWTPIREVYGRAAELYRDQQAAIGKSIATIPFETRIREAPAEEDGGPVEGDGGEPAPPGS